MSGQVPPEYQKFMREQKALSDRIAQAPDIEKAKICIVEFCPSCGGYMGTGEPYPLIARYADLIQNSPGSDLFFDRQKEHVAFAMMLIARGDFMSPPSAVGAAYLATRFELFFRILSGVLEFNGEWKSELLREQYRQQYPHLLCRRYCNKIVIIDCLPLQKQSPSVKARFVRLPMQVR